MDGKKCLALIIFIASMGILSIFSMDSHGWSNNGYSSDPANPDYGTHDWIAEHALDWLPLREKQYLLSNKANFIYGTELPDRPADSGGYEDKSKHHFYYHEDETVQDDIAGTRAQDEYDKALPAIVDEDYALAAKYAGAMTHYISDLAVFGHMMGTSTDWGAETHHSDYEEYVNGKTSSYESNFFLDYLKFDGQLINITAYDAAVALAHDTTFDDDDIYDCVWMDSEEGYDWNDPIFVDRVGESMNYAVNLLADVLHMLAGQGGFLLGNNLPTAVIYAIPLSGEAPLTVNFQGSGIDIDGTIDSYSWDFDDDDISNEQNPIHTFHNRGTYRVTLTVTDNDHGSGTEEVVIEVTDGGICNQNISYAFILLFIIIYIIKLVK